MMLLIIYRKFHFFLIAIFLIGFQFLISCSDSTQDTISPDIISLNVDKFGFNLDSLEVVEEAVQKNETLADILTKAGIKYSLITTIYNKSKPIFDFKKIRPGKKYFLYLTKDTLKTFSGLVYEFNKISYLKVEIGDSIIAKINKHDVEAKEKSIQGVINSSLYETLANKNASLVLAGELAEIFAWQIDFYTIQKGDQYFAVYDELYVNDELAGIGDVKVAKFIHKGNPFFAFLYNQDGKKEYFDENGGSLQKKFLKAPLKYSRISSRYSGRRLHPILRVYKPHRGIDYAAAIGTPVQAVGDGIVVQVGRNGAAGKMVKIRHNSVYTSAYLHLSRYGKGIRKGKKVNQGQVVGYVGSTGRSTGPHLDFRFWKNGSLVNYLTQKFPSSKSVADSNLSQYKIVVDSLMNKLADATKVE